LLKQNSVATHSLYAENVNPQWVRLLDLLDMNVSYQRCQGADLLAEDGTRYLDFLSGYCVHNTGHNHPHIVQALAQELDRCGPVMLQSHVPELAGELAQRLCALAGSNLTKAFFCSSGSEGVEAAIKFARTTTRRNGLLACADAFHGLTCGALSLMNNSFWREGFGPLLADSSVVAFDDLDALEKALNTREYAAFFVEPVQSEGGIRVPAADYLSDAQQLCKRYGTLLVLDEVQTGMFRTGHFLAAQHYDVQPDMVILAKALSGGLIPVGAVLMKEEISAAMYSSLQRAIVHTSTYGENSLAMRAGLATLDVLEQEALGRRSISLGNLLRDMLNTALAPFEMFAGTRGLGLLSGVAFRAPTKLSLKLSFQAFRAIHPAMFGQMLVMRLFRQEKILTQMCGNNFMILKAAPPLIATEEQIHFFVRSVERVVSDMHNSSAFWTESLGLARRAVNI
jgi:ornithine--oxo-acid transaminase